LFQGEDRLRDAVEPEPVEQPGQVIGERLALNQSWQNGPAPLVHEGPLFTEPAVKVVEEQRDPGCHLYELPALG
jgi:hypothetical protein